MTQRKWAQVVMGPGEFSTSTAVTEWKFRGRAAQAAAPDPEAQNTRNFFFFFAGLAPGLGGAPLLAAMITGLLV